MKQESRGGGLVVVEWGRFSWIGSRRIKSLCSWENPYSRNPKRKRGGDADTFDEVRVTTRELGMFRLPKATLRGRKDSAEARSFQTERRFCVLARRIRVKAISWKKGTRVCYYIHDGKNGGRRKAGRSPDTRSEHRVPTNSGGKKKKLIVSVAVIHCRV